MRTALLAAVMTLTQIALFVTAAPGRSVGERYLTAFPWDSVWEYPSRWRTLPSPPCSIGS
jgi:hypothetical protein